MFSSTHKLDKLEALHRVLRSRGAYNFIVFKFLQASLCASIVFLSRNSYNDIETLGLRHAFCVIGPTYFSLLRQNADKRIPGEAQVFQIRSQSS